MGDSVREQSEPDDADTLVLIPAAELHLVRHHRQNSQPFPASSRQLVASEDWMLRLRGPCYATGTVWKPSARGERTARLEHPWQAIRVYSFSKGELRESSCVRAQR